MPNSFNFQFIRDINDARTKPRSTAEQIYNKYSNQYDGPLLNAHQTIIHTVEGIEALNDLCHYLNKVEDRSRLIESDVLSSAAHVIAKEKGAQGKADHETPRAIYSKIQGVGAIQGKIGELIALNTNSPEEASTYFLIDDGLATRKRRRMLMESAYRYIGVGTAPHIHYGSITVVLLAEEITNLLGTHNEHELQKKMEQREYHDKEGHTYDDY